MDKIVGVTDLQRRFRAVFDEVAQHHVPYILTRGSRPEAALIPYDQYLRLIQADEAGVLKRFDELLARLAAANARYSDDEIEADLKDATQAVRTQRSKSHARRR